MSRIPRVLRIAAIVVAFAIVAAFVVGAGSPAPARAADAVCSGCPAWSSGGTCRDCPSEILRILEGKTRITRRSQSLANDCLALDPVHPQLLPENEARLSSPLDPGELENARTYGVRKVRALEACSDLEPRWSERVVLARPLLDAETRRDDGRAKPVVRVDGSDPACLRRPQALRPASAPYCRVSTAVSATRELGGVIIEIRAGTYAEPGLIRLGHGQVLTPANDESVVIDGWLDLSRGFGPKRGWAHARTDETGSLFVLDWSDHRPEGGSAGNELPVELDGEALPMLSHYDATSRAPDVSEPDLLGYDANADGPAFVYANPGRPSSCMHSGVNVKSKARVCEHAGGTLPCESCERRGIPIRSKKLSNAGVCEVRPGTCAPRAGWQTVQSAGLERCRSHLGNHVGACVLLKLPSGDRPDRHAIRSAHTRNGFELSNRKGRPSSGVVIRGIRLENVPIAIEEASSVRAPSGKVARLDGLELIHSEVRLQGSAMELENSYGERGHLIVRSAGDLEAVVVRNNAFDRYYGKPISWGETFEPSALRSPARLHALAPLCVGVRCAANAPRLFSGDERVETWRGWSRVTFNWFRRSAAINAFGLMTHTVVMGNVFEHGGIQEGILDLPFGSRSVWIHHNWASDGLGTGIKLLRSTEDVVVSDNQFHRVPGKLEEGAGTDVSARVCAAASQPCKGAFHSVLLKPGKASCRDVTLDNNLSVGSRGNGIVVEACDGLTLRNNSVHDAERSAWVLRESPVAREPAVVVGNVGLDGRKPEGSVLKRSEAGHPFPLGVQEGNHFQGAAAPVRNDPRWVRGPTGADPSGALPPGRLTWGGEDRCLGGAARFSRPGFNTASTRCSAGPVPSSGR